MTRLKIKGYSLWQAGYPFILFLFLACHRKEPAVIEIFVVSLVTVFLAEMGDRTQLLTLLFTAKIKDKKIIIAAILAATLINHFLSALVGVYLGNILQGPWLAVILGGGFLLMAAWVLIPDKKEDLPAGGFSARGFAAAFMLFFCAEIGDKTQIATLFLAGQYHNFVLVTLGSVAGLLAANVPVLYLGEKFLAKIPPVYVRRAAALVFLVLGIATFICT